tara:strand:- start:281 stop:451 length:171 start_codon:yes stop_codon:yes gene_type:complete
MKKAKLHEVISIQTKNDIIKLNARIGYHLGTGKKINVKVLHGKAVIIEQKGKKHAS